jgi:hypothetical protein
VTYLPDIALILRGLGVDDLPDAPGPVPVSAPFLRFLLSEFAKSAAFDRAFYERTYPDVAAEVARGAFRSAHDHFCRHGFFEGRAAVPPAFDPAWYGHRYPDLAGLDTAALRRHYLSHGRAEGRAGHAGEVAAEAWGEAAGLLSAPADDTELAHATIDQARVQVFGELFNGGPVLGEDRFSVRLRHTRYRRPVDQFDPQATYSHHLPGDWIYGGPAHEHFGHVMSEMVHRLLPSRRLFGDGGIIFIGTEDDEPVTGFESLPTFFQEILDYLAIDPDSVRVLHRNHIVERLHIVEQGSDFGSGPKPGYLAELRRFSVPRLQGMAGLPGPPADAVYVSRSGIEPSGGFLGERLLDEALEAAGFRIFRPEVHPFAVQLAVYRRAKLLLFAEGSACHGTELLGKAMMRTCLLLSRRESHLDIFSGILAPRARVFGQIEVGRTIGTAVAHPEDGQPLDHLGVSLIDAAQLSAFLLSHGAAAPIGLDGARYAEAARQDFATYLDWHRRHSRMLDEAHIDGLKRHLDEALKQLVTT